MKIIRATSSHAPGIAAVHVRAWQAAYSDILSPEFLASLSIADRTRRWERNLAGDPATTAIAILGEEIVGFASWGPGRDSAAAAGQGEVWAAYVNPPHWRKGTGSALLQHALKALEDDGFHEASLWVLAMNKRAISFYERNGFSRLAMGSKLIEIGGTRVEEEKYGRPLQPTPVASVPGRQTGGARSA